MVRGQLNMPDLARLSPDPRCSAFAFSCSGMYGTKQLCWGSLLLSLPTLHPSLQPGQCQGAVASLLLPSEVLEQRTADGISDGLCGIQERNRWRKVQRWVGRPVPWGWRKVTSCPSISCAAASVVQESPFRDRSHSPPGRSDWPGQGDGVERRKREGLGTSQRRKLKTSPVPGLGDWILSRYMVDCAVLRAESGVPLSVSTTTTCY